MKVAVDTSILRRTAAGTQRWTAGLVTALGLIDDLAILPMPGPARLGEGPFFRGPNLLRQRWWYEIGLVRDASESRADVLLMPANLCARRSAIPQVATILDVNFLVEPGTYEWAFARYAEWAFRRTVRTVDAITTLSETSRREICARLGADPQAVSVVYPGLDDLPPAGNGPPPLSDRYALYVGATERHKNVGLLLDVWAAGRPAGLRLAIVGRPGRDHEHLSERANRLGSSVVLRGAVDDAELERWYRHASVFLFPSRTEGFGYPPLEAMQRGVPVIASASGSLPEVLADGALFHDPDDADALRVAVERVMHDRTLHESLVAAGRRRTEDFTWARTGERMAKVLRAIARGT